MTDLHASGDNLARNTDIERLHELQRLRAEALLGLPKAAESLDEAAFMQYAMTQAEDLTGSQIAFIHFVDGNEENIELVTWSKRTLESYCHAVYNRHYPVSQAGIWADAIRQHQVVVFNDYPTYAHKRGLPEGHAHLQRLISLPVIEHGKVVMLCGIGNKAEDYNDEDIDTLQLITNDIWRLIQLSRNRKQLERFSSLIERSHSEILTFDANTLYFVDANAGAQKNLGFTQEELRTMTPLSIEPEITPEVFQQLTKPLLDGTQDVVSFTTPHRRKNGTIYIAEIQLELHREANPLFIAMARDITERLRAEQHLSEMLAEQVRLNHKLEEASNQLLQSEKMASIGQLAAGVAHELNNPIGFVSSNFTSLGNYLADLMAIIDTYGEAESAIKNCCPDVLERVVRMKQEKDYDFLRADIMQLMADSKDGLSRVSGIVKDLRDFSHPGEAQMQWIDVRKSLVSTLNISWNELKYKCTVKKVFGDIPEIWCSPSQLNQVFLNLLVNASHAIPDKGEITITTGQKGHEIFVAIADTGEGIAAENLTRIFDPFFTTKPVGKGTGLGLSLSYGIIKKHGGRIEVASQVGKGSVFTVWLPVQAVPAIPSPSPYG